LGLLETGVIMVNEKKTKETLEESLLKMINEFEKLQIFNFKISIEERKKIIKKLIKIKGDEDYMCNRQEADW